jgi:hypothetical protein
MTPRLAWLAIPPALTPLAPAVAADGVAQLNRLHVGRVETVEAMKSHRIIQRMTHDQALGDSGSRSRGRPSTHRCPDPLHPIPLPHRAGRPQAGVPGTRGEGYGGNPECTRFIVENFRGDQLQYARGISAAQTISILVFLAAACLLTFRGRLIGASPNRVANIARGMSHGKRG